MATTTEYMHYVCERLDAFGAIRSKKMFGEYMVYLDERPILTVCDDAVFVKMLPQIADLMADAPCGAPYPGAKPHYLIDPDDRALLDRLIPQLLQIVPPKMPKSAK